MDNTSNKTLFDQEMALLALKGIQMEHDFIRHKTNADVKFNRAMTVDKGNHKISGSYLIFDVEFDGPNSKHSGEYSMGMQGNTVKGILSSVNNAVPLEMNLHSSPQPHTWAGPSSMLKKVAIELVKHDVKNLSGGPKSSFQALDHQIKNSFSHYTAQASSFESTGSLSERVNHQLSYYLEGLDKFYTNFDGDIKKHNEKHAA